MSTEKTTRKAFRWFWAWNDDKEERWLGEMARAGWHLQSYSILFYTFVKGAPEDVVYRMDYPSVGVGGGLGLQEYLGIFRDAGWEHVLECFGWHYFRTRADAEQAPEIFTDPESRIAKYQRLAALTGLMVCVMVATAGGLPPGVRPEHPGAATVTDTAVLCVHYGFTILLAAVTIRLLLHVHSLRQTRRSRL